MPYPPSVVSLSGYDYEYLPYEELTASEREAVDIIKSTLRAHGLPDEPLYFRYADKYLAVEAVKYSPFARLKLSKSSWYVSLSCGDPATRKKFRRFDISAVSEIAGYESYIIAAYHFASNIPAEKEPVEVVSSEISPDVSELFRNILLRDGSSTFEPTADEIAFFSAYVESLKAAGLDWKSVHLELMSDGAIKARGGRIKLRKRGSYMMYLKSKKELATTVKNLTLSEYIELQKFWIADCIENKALYSL